MRTDDVEDLVGKIPLQGWNKRIRFLDTWEQSISVLGGIFIGKVGDNSLRRPLFSVVRGGRGPSLGATASGTLL